MVVHALTIVVLLLVWALVMYIVLVPCHPRGSLEGPRGPRGPDGPQGGRGINAPGFPLLGVEVGFEMIYNGKSVTLGHKGETGLVLDDGKVNLVIQVDDDTIDYQSIPNNTIVVAFYNFQSNMNDSNSDIGSMSFPFRAKVVNWTPKPITFAPFITYQHQENNGEVVPRWKCVALNSSSDQEKVFGGSSVPPIQERIQQYQLCSETAVMPGKVLNLSFLALVKQDA